MLRLSNSIRFLTLILLFSAAAIPAHADGISNPLYSITGVMIFTGNNSCTPAPCTEAIAFSFNLGYQKEEYFGQYFYFAYTTNVTQIWTGDMASFTQSSSASVQVPGVFPTTVAGCNDGGDGNYVEFFDTAVQSELGSGDEADIHLCEDGRPTPVVPSLDYANLYRCETSACSSGFTHGVFAVGVLEDVVVTQIPEPPTFILLASGMLALGLLGATHRKIS